LPRDAKMTDVPSHCWALPTILAHAGVEFLHLGCNRASTPPQAPPLFWWEGPDGSRVMTMLVLGYGTGLLPPENWPHKTWLALIHTGDNHGPPTPEEVKKLLADAARQLPGAKIRMGRLSDFADAIRRENPDLPVVRADMPDSWIHGIMSHPQDTATARRVRPQIAQLEALNTLLSGWGVAVPEVKDTIAQAYEQSLMYGEHTWGMDAKRFPRLYGKAWEESYAKGTYAKAEESWEEQGDYIRQAAWLVEPALAEHVKRLADNVATTGPRVVVYNPLPWKRTDVVSFERADGTTARFVACDLPPMGYKAYALADVDGDGAQVAKLDEAGRTIENARLRVKVDPARGGVVSLLDKQSGREFVAPGEVLGRYLYQTFDADDAQRYIKQYSQGKWPWIEGDFGKPGLPPAAEAPGRDASPGDFDLRYEQDGVALRAIMTAKPTETIPHAVGLAVTVYHELPFVDLEWTIVDKPATPWPEAGWLCLPLAMDNASYLLGRPGAFVDPATDRQPASNADMFCLSSGMTVRGSDGALVGICPLDSPVVSIGEPGLWRFSREFKPKAPAVYVNLFNNQWSTNFSQWVGGSWSARVRIWPGKADDASSILAVAAVEARNPVLAAFSDAPAGKLPASQAGLSLSRTGTVVTAFGANPDGAGTLLRIWELSGRTGSCVVTLPPGSRFKTAQPCDLRGRSVGDAIAINHGCFECDVAAFAPRSFLLE